MKRKRDLSCDSESNGTVNEEESNGVEGPLAILWDTENCCVPSVMSPEIVVDNTRKYLRGHGIKAPITLFTAYGDFRDRNNDWKKSFQRSGVNLILVSNRRPDAADKAILVDMLLFAMDNPPPSSILLISGDVDFAPALHRLGQRGYSILVAALNLDETPDTLLSAAKIVWDWRQMASNGKSQRSKPQSLSTGAETTSKPSPASTRQLRKSKRSVFEDVKKEILSLLHRKEGCIALAQIPALYQHTFEKPLNRKRYGCKLQTLLERMEDDHDIHVHRQGSTACVYLISQGKCLCPQSNMNSDAPNHKNVTEAGGGLPSETEIQSNRNSHYATKQNRSR